MTARTGFADAGRADQAGYTSTMQWSGPPRGGTALKNERTMTMPTDLHGLLTMRRTDMADTMRSSYPGRRRAMWAAVLLAALGAGGCSSMGSRSSVVVAPAQSTATTESSATASGESSLAAIIRNQLQLGHYDTGEKALRQHLRQHPGDRAAQGMLRQLTVDPEQMLGSRWHAHIVQAGESYSTLAERYLGDANLFLILARYNGSANPSLLRVGQTLRIPAPAEGAAPAAVAAADAAAPVAPASPPPGAESAAAKARRLQDESVALLDQGRKQQALARLGEALAIEPRLKPSGTKAATLRSQLLDSYHERAIVLYRDQQLDPAIALWDRVLAIAPDYEPAVIYRARARELKHRLEQY